MHTLDSLRLGLWAMGCCLSSGRPGKIPRTGVQLFMAKTKLGVYTDEQSEGAGGWM